MKIAWGWTDKQVKPVVKYNGKCLDKSQWKYCPYWMAKHRKTATKKVLGYKCSLFDKDKEGKTSLSECNAKYGTTYEGDP